MSSDTNSSRSNANHLADPEEQQLLDRLLDGDEAAYEQLVRQYGARMLASALRILENREDAEDAVQEAFRSAFAALNSFRGQSRLGTWLHRIAINAALAIRRARRQESERSLEALLPRFSEDGWPSETPADWNESAAVLLDQQETRERVMSAIGELPDDYREVLMLRDIEQLDTSETAQALRISEANVKVRLHRARQALCTLLDPYFRERAVL